MKNIKEEEFWKDIIYKNGKIDEEQVMKELSDFSYVMNEVPKVYEEITGGILSKIMYPAEVVLKEFNEQFWSKDIIKDDVKNIIKEEKTLKGLKEEIRHYFNLN